MRAIHRLGAIVIASSIIGAVACENEGFINFVPTNPAVTLRDQCDSASFNAALGPGVCVKAGLVSYDEFLRELDSTQRVVSWRFDPGTLSVKLGQAINALNVGGEEHTFTRVEAYGGGTVPQLNIASGNLIPAPECLRLTQNDYVLPGHTFQTLQTEAIGPHRYQCCIHPWMRASVNVIP